MDSTRLYKYWARVTHSSGERTVRIRKVKGSNPSVSTTKRDHISSRNVVSFCYQISWHKSGRRFIWPTFYRRRACGGFRIAFCCFGSRRQARSGPWWVRPWLSSCESLWDPADCPLAQYHLWDSICRGWGDYVLSDHLNRTMFRLQHRKELCSDHRCGLSARSSAAVNVQSSGLNIHQH